MQISISQMSMEFVGCVRHFPKARCRVRLKGWKWGGAEQSSQGQKAYNEWLQRLMTRPMPPSIPWPQILPGLPVEAGTKCPRCGINWNGPMSYCCPHPGCMPTSVSYTRGA